MRRRTLIAGAVALTLLIAAIVLLGRPQPYIVHARFSDAGQLVKGDLVEVGGLPVGKVTALSLAPDGEADVRLSITRGRFTPLHEGTVAQIRAYGLSGIANRFVDVMPGPAANAEIADHGVLHESATRPFVDLDELLNSLDARARAQLQGLIRGAATAVAGTAPQARRDLLYLTPAIAQTGHLAGQLTLDRHALGALIASGAGVAHALAGHSAQLAAGVSSTAALLGRLAAQHGAVGDSLQLAPGVLTHASRTLARVRDALGAVDPALAEARPLAAPLAALLRRLAPVARAATPQIAHLRHLLPVLRAGLDGLPGLRDAGLPALAASTRTLRGLLPVLAGVRPYTPDLIAGLFQGFGGAASASYDANGHYARIAPVFGPGSLTPGVTSAQGGYRTGDIARCPGGAVEPAPDGSNPFVPDPAICDRAHDHP